MNAQVCLFFLLFPISKTDLIGLFVHTCRKRQRRARYSPSFRNNLRKKKNKKTCKRSVTACLLYIKVRDIQIRLHALQAVLQDAQGACFRSTLHFPPRSQHDDPFHFYSSHPNLLSSLKVRRDIVNQPTNQTPSSV